MADDDVINQKSYSNAPNMNPDSDDDVTNVKPAGYENVLSVRMEQYNDRLVSSVFSLKVHLGTAAHVEY